MIPGSATVRRSVRTVGGKLLRRAGLLPGGVPDRLGDDAEWQDRSFEGEVIVFFADTIGGLYQLRTWYGPLVELHKSQGLTIVCMDSRTARAIRSEVDLPVMTISQESFLDELIARSNVKVFLYVNYTQMNFLALRIRSVIHVSLLHGDSDKTVSVSNQVKAFDYSFVAGQAAIDRFNRYTSLFDAEAHCVKIGRPQNDTDVIPGPRPDSPSESPVVLYAPTWEGGHDSVSYSSVASHGREIVESLSKAGLRVIYRPHPLIGQRLAHFGEADIAIRRFLAGQRAHRVSTKRDLYDDFAMADMLICDVSSVASDWLITERPLAITRTSVRDTREAATSLPELAPRVAESDARSAGALAWDHIANDPTKDDRRALAEYYLGDTSPGASLERFLTACRDAAAMRDQEWARISSNEGAG